MGHSGTPAVSCSYKAASGMIYPLERGFMFVYKPPIFVKFEDVNVVNFARSGGSNRSFDIEVHTRGETVYTFSSIEKDEYHRLYEYLKNKKIVVKSSGKMDSSKLDLSGDNIDHFAETEILVPASMLAKPDSCMARTSPAETCLVHRPN